MHARKHKATQILSITQDWLGALSAFIKGLKTCEFDTVDALLAAVAYDEPAAGLMLKRVLHWHTNKSGGEFYLSQRDWWRQCRVNRKTVDRVKTKIFPLCGITVEVKSIGHGKATHYRLHEGKFLRRLAQVINLPMVFIVNRICPKWTDGYVQKGQMGMSESDVPLTIESTIETANDVVKNNVVPSKKIVDFKSDLTPIPSPLRREGGRESTPEQLRVIEALKKAHVPGQRAVSFALLPESIVQDCITSANEPGVKNRVGYLIGALQKQLQAHKTQPLSESAVTTTPPPNPLPVAEEVGQDGDFADSHESNFTANSPTPESLNERLSVIINERWTAQSAWGAIYQQVQMQLDRNTFEWIRHATLMDYEPENKCFVVRVHNARARDMCQYALKTVHRLAQSIFGMVVRFETDNHEPHDAPLQRFLNRKAEN